jgi:hypothetical protein
MHESMCVAFQHDHDALSFPSLRRQVVQTVRAAASNRLQSMGLGALSPYRELLVLSAGLDWNVNSGPDHWYFSSRLATTTPSRNVEVTVSVLATREVLAVRCVLEYGARRVSRASRIPDYGAPDIVRELIELCPRWRIGPSVASTRPITCRGKRGAIRLLQLIDAPERTLPIVAVVCSELGRDGLDWSARLASQLAGQVTVVRLDAAARAALVALDPSRFEGRAGSVTLALPRLEPVVGDEPALVPLRPCAARDRSAPTRSELTILSSLLHCLALGPKGGYARPHPAMVALDLARKEALDAETGPEARVIPISRPRACLTARTEVQQ